MPEFPRAIRTYVKELEKGNFDGAAAMFTADAFYSHPEVEPGGPRIEIIGRDAIRSFLVNDRGHRPVEHRQTRFVMSGANCFSEGELYENGVLTGSFVVSFTLDSEGLIEREAAYLCVPAIGTGIERV